jgi:hypothetical protein
MSIVRQTAPPVPDPVHPGSPGREPIPLPPDPIPREPDPEPPPEPGPPVPPSPEPTDRANGSQGLAVRRRTVTE